MRSREADHRWWRASPRPAAPDNFERERPAPRRITRFTGDIRASRQRFERTGRHADRPPRHWRRRWPAAPRRRTRRAASRPRRSPTCRPPASSRCCSRSAMAATSRSAGVLRHPDRARARLHVDRVGVRRRRRAQLAARAVRRTRAAGRVGDDPATLIASTYMPVGRVTPVDGGFRLSGHWKFSSGSELCEGVPRRAGAAGRCRPAARIPHLPAAESRLPDPAGLGRARPARDGQPRHRRRRRVRARVPHAQGHRRDDGHGFRASPSTMRRCSLPFAQIFVRAVCTSCIGALQGALDDFTGYAATRVSANSGAKTTDDPGAQNACANAAVAIDEMQVLLKRNFAELMASVTGGPAVSIERRVHFRYQSAQVAERCAQAANALPLRGRQRHLSPQSAGAPLPRPACGPRALREQRGPFWPEPRRRDARPREHRLLHLTRPR